jgi:hypothetical protein
VFKVGILRGISNAWIILLIVYFCILIAGSLITAVAIWKPTSQSTGTNSTHIVDTPLSSTNKSAPASSTISAATASTKTISNNASGTTIRNIISYVIIDKNLKREIVSTSFIPSSLERETRLIGLSILFGIIGASVHAVTSLTIWHSRNKLERSFFSWYITRPLIGAALAATIYLLLRSSLLTTVANGSQAGGITFINDYGVAGISALVGLMTAQMTQKLRDVFDAMFGIQKGTDKGDIDVTENNIVVIPKELQIGVNQSSVLVATVKDNANKPLSSINVHFGIVDSNVVKPLDSTYIKTDSNGMAILQIHANKEGITKVLAAIEIENKPIYDTSTIKVIENRGAAAVEERDVTSTKKNLSI